MFVDFNKATIFQGKVVKRGSFNEEFKVNKQGILYLVDKSEKGKLPNKIGEGFKCTENEKNPHVLNASYSLSILIGLREVLDSFKGKNLEDYVYKRGISKELVEYYEHNIEKLTDEERRAILGTKKVKFLNKEYEVPNWAKGMFVNEEGSLYACERQDVVFNHDIYGVGKYVFVDTIDMDEYLTKSL